MPNAELKDNGGGTEPKIGVFVCHCGTNIGGVVDCEKVAKAASTIEGVAVSKDLKYACSDLGQDEIQKAIKEEGLNRIVVASCSPRLHEFTFRNCVEEAGLNPYFMIMVNLREQCSWVHMKEPEDATAKASDLIRMGVERSKLLSSLSPREVAVEPTCLVIGAGIAGIQAALDVAQKGFKTYLVEKEPSIGGHMAQLDKTFPTGDCAICILAPKMVEASRQKNLEILAYSEVVDIDGYVGNFNVKVRMKPRYVDEEKCVGCGVCTEKCPVKVPNEFDVGFGMRKAIYVPFPQAVPLKYTIDAENCRQLQGKKCGACAKACINDAIDYEQQPRDLDLKVGTIIIATGFDTYIPMKKGVYSYWESENVITAMELERLINAAGPTGGHLIRPSDKTEPKRIAFIQCVGSRNHKLGIQHCSRVCCMYAMKNAQIIKEHDPETDIAIYYNDIRAFGKGFEELYHRIRMDYGVEFIRGRPARLTTDPETGNITIRAEETLLAKITERDFDLVVLSVGLLPSQGTMPIQKMLSLPTSPDGFLQELHPKLRPIETAIDGVFICGCAQGPKDIPDSVAQAKATASEASTLMIRSKHVVEPLTASINDELCVGCGLCTDVCPYGAIELQDKDGQIKAVVTEALCHGCGTCAAACPQRAIDQLQFSNRQIMSEISAALSHEKAAGGE
ncbi:MAG TPA: CoB--CoM heterodisulfide reductase iron-sulfur subunit A family protein [Euryarchaeota archaeon]|nr:CoB--CoM heterodisulfide reductase iron-sulfur subunit A family protein [Euryarchaeota archaeon]